MNLIGYRKKGMKEAMWITSNIDQKRALEIYLDRMNLIRQRVTLPGKEVRKMKVLAYRLFQQMLQAPDVFPT